MRNVCLAMVAEVMGIASDDIIGKTHKPMPTMARHLTMWMLHRLCGYSTTEVGRLLHRDHSSVVYACSRVVLGYYGLDHYASDLKAMFDKKRKNEKN